MKNRKDELLPGSSANTGSPYESKGPGELDRVDSTGNYSGSRTKWIELNSASENGFAVPVHLIQLTKLSSSERMRVLHRLKRELEQTRVMEKRFESQKTEFVNVQQKRLQVCNMKKSYELREKGGGWNRSNTGKFLSAKRCVQVDTKTGILKQCESLLKSLMSHNSAWAFNAPVDVVGLNLPDYFDIIKSPMDLGTIKAKLSSEKGYSPLDFLRDIRLTFMNAKTYNLPGDKVHTMADKMSRFFEVRWKAIEKKLVMSTSQSLPEKSRIREETTTINKPIIHPKKRKPSPSQYEVDEVVVREPKRPKITYEEKQKLSSEVEDLLADLPVNVDEFLKAQSSNAGDGGEDENVINVYALSDDALFTLRKLLDDHLTQKKLTNSEICEIELPNVSCLSNSSLQVDGENDYVEEDVDIGDEAPVTSCPPIEIDKDVEERAEECTEAASVSGLDQLEHDSQLKQYSSDSEGHEAAESELAGRQVSPDRQNRAAFLKSRFSETILKAREKTLTQDGKRGPVKLRQEREKLEMHKKREKARFQAEKKAAEEARKQAESEAAEEAKKRIDLDRRAAREALLKMEKTVEINDNSTFLQDMDILRFFQPDQQLPINMDQTSPDPPHNEFGSFSFGVSNPLEQLGLYMKEDTEEEDSESLRVLMAEYEVEEGEI